MQKTKSFFSQNFLEILIICLLVWILGQNISFQNKMETLATNHSDRLVTLEWALMIDPNTPKWIKDQITHPTRGNVTIPSNNSLND